MAKSEVKSFVQRVLDRVTGGEEAKIGKFFTKTEAHIKKQIDARKEKIAELNEKIEFDLSDEIAESIEMVDVERIKTVDSTNNYINTYVQKQIKVLEKKYSLEEEIAKFENEIKALEEVSTLMKASKKEEAE